MEIEILDKSTTAAIVVTIFNEASSIKQFFNSIQEQTRKPEEVIFVDGGSTDATIQILKECALSAANFKTQIITSTDRINIAQGRNVGIRHATSRIVAVTDAGCVLDCKWFEEITSPLLADQSLDVVSGWYVPNCKTKFQKQFARLSIPKLTDINPNTFLPSSRSIAFRKSIWERIGGYPEFLTLSAEDTLFDIYLKKAGAKFLFNPKAFVSWSPRKTFRKALWIQFSMGRGDGEAIIGTKAYLFYLIGIVIPPILLTRQQSHKNFILFYSLKTASVFGWIVGLWNHIRKVRHEKQKWEIERQL